MLTATGRDSGQQYQGPLAVGATNLPSQPSNLTVQWHQITHHHLFPAPSSSYRAKATTLSSGSPFPSSPSLGDCLCVLITPVVQVPGLSFVFLLTCLFHLARCFSDLILYYIYLYCRMQRAVLPFYSKIVFHCVYLVIHPLTGICWLHFGTVVSCAAVNAVVQASLQGSVPLGLHLVAGLWVLRCLSLRNHSPVFPNDRVILSRYEMATL